MSKYSCTMCNQHNIVYCFMQHVHVHAFRFKKEKLHVEKEGE